MDRVPRPILMIISRDEKPAVVSGKYSASGFVDTDEIGTMKFSKVS